MTKEFDQERHLQFMYEKVCALEALAEPGDLPADLVQDAAARRAELVGETYRTLEREAPAFAAELQQRIPEVPWRGWYDLRNVLAHQLMRVDPRAVADAARNDAPVLRRGLEREFGTQLVQEREAERQREPDRGPPAQPAALRQTHDPDLLDFCYRRRGLQPGEEPTEQDILVYNWVRAPKRINPRLAAARSLGRERRAILRRERGGGS